MITAWHFVRTTESGPVLRDGRPVMFTAGDRVSLWVGPPDKTSLVFMGKAVDEHDVLDLISTESDDELDDYESI